MGVYATFPGIDFIQRASYVAVRGFIPGVATLEILPQESIDTVIGDLVIGDDLNNVTIYDCIVDGMSVVRNTTGMIVRVKLKDSRWRFKGAAVTGMYNLRAEDGTIDTPTERTPQQLLTILLTAMGIGSTDVSDVPNLARPQMEWEAHSAWAEATKLMHSLGCEYVPSYSGGAGSIVRIGTGTGLTPDDYTQTYAISADLEENPDELQYITERDAWQAKFKLEAVGVDTDGAIVPIAELSYAPDPDADDGGWTREDPSNLVPNADPDEHGLATATVYRWYRIKEFSPEGLILPNRDVIEGIGQPSDGTGTDGQYYKDTATNDVYFKSDGHWSLTADLIELDDIRQALPLLEKLIQEVSGDFGYAKRFPFVEGIFVKKNGVENLENTEFDTVTSLFELDHEDGIVKFEEPVAKLVTGGFAPADLYLTVAFHIRSADRTQWHRFGVNRILGSNNVPAAVRMADGLRRTFVTSYTDDEPDSTTDNTATVAAELENLLDAWELEYGTLQATYSASIGIRPIALSGKIASVRWIADHETGANTLATQNSETNVASYKRSERHQMAVELTRRLNYDRQLRDRRRRGD